MFNLRYGYNNILDSKMHESKRKIDSKVPQGKRSIGKRRKNDETDVEPTEGFFFLKKKYLLCFQSFEISNISYFMVLLLDSEKMTKRKRDKGKLREDVHRDHHGGIVDPRDVSE